METAKSIREDFLQQNAFVDEDAYSSYQKQFKLLDTILKYDALCRDALGKGADMTKLFTIPVREKLGRAKMADAEKFGELYDGYVEEMKKEISTASEGARKHDKGI